MDKNEHKFVTIQVVIDMYYKKYWSWFNFVIWRANPLVEKVKSKHSFVRILSKIYGTPWKEARWRLPETQFPIF